MAMGGFGGWGRFKGRLARGEMVDRLVCVVGEKEDARTKTKKRRKKDEWKEVGDVRKLTALVRVQWPVYVELFSALI